MVKSCTSVDASPAAWIPLEIWIGRLRLETRAQQSRRLFLTIYTVLPPFVLPDN
jgi:hypothetical protein